MKRLAISLALVPGLLLAACGGGDTVSGPECSSNDDCVAGYLCLEQKCTARAAVEIVTSELPDALAGADYEVELEAQGGEPPYTWSLLQGPAWLVVDTDTGELTGHPEQAQSGITIEVEVQDSTSGRDSSTSKSFTIDVNPCSDGETVVCTEVQEGKCMYGRRVCRQGEFGACEDLDFSTDFEKCGPECSPCDDLRADACRQGSCTCGAGTGCSDGELCCSGLCVSADSPDNCGACGRSCGAELANSENVRCENGQCVSDGCLEGWLDCDGNPANGCDTQVSLQNCGACGEDCSAVAHVEQVACESTDSGPACGYQGDGSLGEGCQLGWLDCDGDRTNGCETAVDEQNCGYCGMVCSSQCQLHPNGDHYFCGCLQDDDCGNGFLCCSEECVSAADPRHCGSCANDCTAQVANAPAVCSNGLCDHGPCQGGWFDCDGNTANGCERAQDDANCGACDLACGPNSACELSSGTCQCTGTYQDCDDEAANGCESNRLIDAENCGSCEVDCTRDLQNVIGPACNQGSCDYAACQSYYLDCDGNRGNGCERAMDAANCGSCGFSCGPNTTCDQGSCACTGTYDNCLGGWADGCETDLATSSANCGACGNDCSDLDHVADVSCQASACQIGSCQEGWGNCDPRVDNGCETDLTSTVVHCGDCATDCNAQLQNVTGPACNLGSCDYAACQSYFLDCDNNRGNGCEQEMNNANCGSCGFACGQHAACDMDACACLGDWGNCYNGWADGCETDLASTASDCGSCGNDCLSLDHVSGASCQNRACRIDSCDAGWFDCDGNAASGCEDYLWETTACGNDCNLLLDCTVEVENATQPTCNQGSCDYFQCNTCILSFNFCYADCNGDRSDGCEYDLWEPGSCKSDCSDPGVDCTQEVQNASEIDCRGGACNYSSCWFGYLDCDGDRSNGCEVEKNTDPQNCGSCGNACDAAADCENGVCVRKAQHVYASTVHTCAILRNDRVKCWGANSTGQLGLGDTEDRGDEPGEMGDALPYVDLGTGRTAKQLALGLVHTCALLDNNRVKCWGGNSSGQLGLGDTQDRGDDPGEMGDSLPYVNLGTGRTALYITAGESHTCAVLDNFRLKCWGSNYNGQLGLGDIQSRGDGPNEMGDDLPQVDLGAGKVVTYASAGARHTCAFVLNDLSVKCWGDNYYGQLGLGDTQNRGDGPGEMGSNLPFVNVGTGRTVATLDARGFHVCVKLDDDLTKCWGNNGHGQLGFGDTNNRGDQAGEMGDDLPYTPLGPSRTVQSLWVGGFHACAWLDLERLKCWGSNTYGQLGLGDTNDRGDEPGEMGGLLPYVGVGTGRTVEEMGLGNAHSCALLDNQRVKCWGANNHGQLGLGDTNYRGDQAGEMGDNLPFLNL